jgi:hypothetical protein
MRGDAGRFRSAIGLRLKVKAKNRQRAAGHAMRLDLPIEPAVGTR